MPWLDQRPSGVYHVAFRFHGQQLKKSLRTKELPTAEARLHQLEENLRLLEKGRLPLPENADLMEFLLSDGKLGEKSNPVSKFRTLKQFSEAFLESIPEGALEENTLETTGIHYAHLKRVLGSRFKLATLKLDDLQGYVDRRSLDKGRYGKRLSPTTIKKEIATLRELWNWAKHSKHLSGEFPSRGLRYPKTTEKPPFQTWEEILRKLDAYELTKEQQAELWECLFLTTGQIDELLADVRQNSECFGVYAMFVFAAHTGARRSELIRSQMDDIDLFARTATIREKKRVRGRCTTRTVPISPQHHKVMTEWLGSRKCLGPTFPAHPEVFGLVGDTTESLSPTAARDIFRIAIRYTKWKPIRGWHVFRHSFCSNCAAAGIDQRVINSWVGHQTEEMVKRYRHLIPNQQQEAIQRVFMSSETSEDAP